jgi:hypothetical protein
MGSYWNRHGLLNASDSEDVSENCPLFTLEYIILAEKLGMDVESVKLSLINYFELCYNKDNGMFDNIPGVREGNDKYISHDQYTAMCAFSARHNLPYHKMFWEGIKHGTYDNLTGKFNIKKPMHPRDIIYIGYLNNSFICKLLMPLFNIITIESALQWYKWRPTYLSYILSGFSVNSRPNKIVATDGDLLAFVRAYGLNQQSITYTKTFSLYCLIMKLKFKDGFNDVFRTYFPNPNHPVRILQEQLALEDL